jgi:AraC family transcriptional regulator, melibiose operon regulatory protein
MDKGSLFDTKLLEGSFFPRIYAYYFKQWNEFRMPFHQHDSTEIMYVIQGDCVVEMNESPCGEPAIQLKKGDFIVLDGNIPHRLIVEQRCRMLNVEFGFGANAGVFPSIGELAAEEESLAGLLTSPVCWLTLQDPDEVHHSLKSLVLELDSRGGDGGILDRLLLSQLLIRIGRLHNERQKNGRQPIELYVKQSIQFLHQNYDRNILVKDVAAYVNLHPGYLHRVFKAQTGQTLMEYLTGLRMEKAKMLLRNTDIPVADVSDYTGIGSRQYFHALFKKHTNQTPIEFRNSMDAHRWDDR